MKVTIIAEKDDRKVSSVVYDNITVGEITEMNYDEIASELYASLFAISRKMVFSELDEINERLEALDAKMQAFLAEMREGLI